MKIGSRWARALLLLLALVVGIQWIPYGRDHSNPEVVREPAWSDAQTRALFYQTCRDCHSNETEWPWYSHVAPISWLVRWDVQDGRSHFNVSEWGREHNHGDEASAMVKSGEMPLWTYRLLHSKARLSRQKRKAFAAGLESTFGAEEPADAASTSEPAHAHEHGDAHSVNGAGR